MGWGRELRDAGTQRCEGLERPFVLLPWSARPSHTITPQTSYLKIHRCCRTGRTQGENILYCHFPPPHLSQLLPLPFSAQLVLSPPVCESARAPRENVCSDRKLLFSRQELSQGLWLKEVFCIVYGYLWSLLYTVVIAVLHTFYLSAISFYITTVSIWETKT